MPFIVIDERTMLQVVIELHLVSQVFIDVLQIQELLGRIYRAFLDDTLRFPTSLPFTVPTSDLDSRLRVGVFLVNC